MVLAVVLAAVAATPVLAGQVPTDSVFLQYFFQKNPANMSAFADLEPSPLEQLRAGTPTDGILCHGGKVLVQGSGRPACVSQPTADKLQQRGWIPAMQSAAGRADPVQGRDPDAGYPAMPPEISDANNSFAVDFYRQVSSSDRHAGKNLFFSPTSMHVAFSALYEGAREDTAAQMEDVFGFDPDMQARHDAMGRLLASLNRDDPHATLDMANALWVAKQYGLYESYTDTLRGVYLAHVENVAFTDPEDGVKKVNQWASDSTNERIKKILMPGDVDDLTLAVITNAIYFKGTWLVQFPEDRTAEDDFWTGTDYVRADFMRRGEPGPFSYAQSDGAQVLRLPYKGDRLSMLVVLPDDRDGIKDLEDSLSADMVRKWQDGLRNAKVVVSIPKFEMKTNYDLAGSLARMGMPDAFSEGAANLTGVANVMSLPGNIYVSKAAQDAYVKVNEEGTEAAAVTTIVATTDSKPPPPPRFVADHPFIFLIQDDESGAILFMGKVTDPTIVTANK